MVVHDPAVKKIRSFIAIELPSSVKRSLAELAGALRAGGIRASWVREENYHLSVRFLGYISDEQRAGVETAFSEACMSFAPFQIEAVGCGVFPNVRAPRVLWAGVSGELAPLQTVAREAERVARAAGLDPVNTPYKAHITLGRIHDPKTAAGVERLLEKHKGFAGGANPVERVSLFASELRSSGAEYTRLETFELVEAG